MPYLRTLLFFLIALPAPASALDLPPVGVDRDRSYACDPQDPVWTSVVTWGRGGDFDPDRGATMVDARRALPPDGNPLLGILPGRYDDVDLLYVGGETRQKITVCGIGPERPVLTGIGDALEFGDIDHVVVRHLEIANGGILTHNPRWLSLRVEGVFVHDLNFSNCIFVGPPSPQRLAERGLARAEVTLRDVELARCGAGNLYHNVYLSARRLRVDARRVSSYAANDSHAFKSLAEILVIRDSYFATVADFQNLDDGPWSTALLDAVACGETVVNNVHFKSTFTRNADGIDDNWRGTPSAIYFRARRDIFGCDLPPYDSAQFDDPAFWAGVGATSLDDPNHPQTFKKFLSDLTVEFVDADGSRPVAGLRNDGTYPRAPQSAFEDCSIFLSAPPNWVERSVIFSGNIDWRGYRAGERHALDLDGCVNPASDADATLPPPPRTLRSVGGEDGAAIALPDWFRTGAAPLFRSGFEPPAG